MEKDYRSFASNIFSQNGEDGILYELLTDLNIKDGFLVDIGAWNGIYLSNIYRIWKNNLLFSALLIEPDRERFKILKKIKKKNPNLVISNNEINSKSNINKFIKNKFPKINKDNFTLINIDVDSCDYQILEQLKLEPKIIIIEHTFNDDIYFEQITDNVGSSFYSIYKLATSKGYKLVCDTHNSIFIRKDICENMPEVNTNIKHLACTKSELKDLQRMDSLGEVRSEIFFQTSDYKKHVESELMKNFTIIDKIKSLVEKHILRKQYFYVE